MGQKEEKHKAWEIGKELSIFSLKHEVQRREEIIKSFKQISLLFGAFLMVFIVFGIEAVTYGETGEGLLGIAVFILLAGILLLSLFGQYHDKREFTLTISELREFFKKSEVEYESEAKEKFLFLDQIEKIQEPLRLENNKKAELLRKCQLLIFTFVILFISLAFSIMLLDL